VAPAAHATRIDNWLIGPTLGLLFGWITAANVVGLAGTLIAQGFVTTGQGAEIRDAALLLLGGAAAFFVILMSRKGPFGAWVSFSAAALWALVAVIVEQRATSTITTAAAVVSAALVLLAAFRPWGTPVRWAPQSESAA
jgi:biotin transporter BioY